MAFIRDLDACHYFPSARFPPLLAVGWLERGHEYAIGDPGQEVRGRLVEFQFGARLWQPSYWLGGHGCDFCGRGPDSIYNLFVPGQGVTYVAPEGILHYVSHHAYLPPAEFCAALVASPTVNSAEYFSVLQANGWPRELASVERVAKPQAPSRGKRKS